MSIPEPPPIHDNKSLGEYFGREPQPTRPDPGQPEWESWRERKRRRAAERRRQRERRIAELECELGIACNEGNACTHWLKMEDVW